MNVHKHEDKKLVEYLRHLGLSTDEISAYLHLIATGSHTVLSLSRGLNTGRTKLYPLLDGLVEKQLITVHERHYGTSYEACNLETLDLLVRKHESRSAQLRNDLPQLVHSLKKIQMQAPTNSHIAEYPGLDGIKQLYWSLSQASGERYVLEYSPIKKKLGSAFLAQHPINGVVVSNIKTADHFLDPAVFTIQQEVHVYGTLVAVIAVDGGVLIQNQLLAEQYRQQVRFLYSLTVTPRQNAT